MAEEKVEATETKETTTVDGGKDGDKTKVEVTVTTKAKGDETKISEETDVITETVTEDGEYKPLFDEEEELTEANLTGEEEKTPDEKGDETKEQPADQKAEEEKQAAKESEGKKATEEAEAKVKADEELKAKEEADAKAAKEKADKKPPEGFVPHAAMHEFREKWKESRDEVDQLKAEIATIKAEKAELEMPDGFKVLTDLELEELIEESPNDAIRYQAQLAKYEKQQSTAKESMREQQREAESVVMTTVDRIEKAVPGIYDGEKAIAKDLANFAIESGFKDEAFLDVMTNPATVVIPAGTDKRVLLSNGAASLIEMLHKIHTSSAEGKEEVDVEKIRSDIRKEETETIKAEVTKDLLAKLKPEHVPTDYRSIEDLAGSQDVPVASTKQYTEDEWERLSEADQEKLLGG